MQNNRLLMWTVAAFLVGFGWRLPDRTIVTLSDRLLSGLLIGVFLAIIGFVVAAIASYVLKERKSLLSLPAMPDWVLVSLILITIVLKAIDGPAFMPAIMFMMFVL